MKRKVEKETTENPTVYGKLARLDWHCARCRANRGDNKKRRAKHGSRKPKKKNKRS